MCRNASHSLVYSVLELGCRLGMP